MALTKEQRQQIGKQAAQDYTPTTAAAPGYIDDPNADMDFGTKWDLARAEDDPQLQREILAKELGISPQSIKDTPDGLAYPNEQGQMVLVNPSDLQSMATRFGADMLSKPGSMIGGTAGALLGGPVGAVAGAAGGDVIQSGAEELLGGHDRSLAEYAKSAGLEGLFAGVGEGIYRGGRGIKNALARKFAGRSNVSQAELEEAARLMEAAKARDIPLTVAEATGDKQMLNTQSWLRDVPNESSVNLENFMEDRLPRIEAAVGDFVGDKSVAESNDAFTQGLRGEKFRLKKDRSDAAGPFYEAAGDTIADIQPVIENLATRIEATEGTKIGNSLKRAYKGITRMEGDQPVPKELISELHLAKLDLDDAINAATRKGNNVAARELLQVQNELLDVIESASMDYKAGREIYREMSGPVNRFDEGVTGQLMKESEKPAPRMGKILFGPQSSPEQVRFTRRSINNDEVFTDMVMATIKDEFSRLNSSAIGSTQNAGGTLAKTVFGSQYKRDLLKAALPEDRYASLEDFMTVLEATGKGFRGQSTTAQRQMMNERATPMGMRLFSGAHKAYQQRGFDDVTENLSRVLTNDYTSDQLAKAADKIRRFAAPKTPKEQQELWDAIATGSGLIFGTQVTGSE